MGISEQQIEQFENKVNCLCQKILRAKAKHMHHGLVDRFDRARSWLERSACALRVQDYEQAFIGLWIALNALYGLPEYKHPWKESSDTLKRIKAYIGLLKNADEVALWTCVDEVNRNVKIVSFMHNRFLTIARWTKEQSDVKDADRDLDKARLGLQDERADKVLESLLSRIRVLRNQIFHGCSTNNRGTNRGSLLPCIRVLMIVIPAFLNIMLMHTDHGRWGELPYPRAHP